MLGNDVWAGCEAARGPACRHVHKPGVSCSEPYAVFAGLALLEPADIIDPSAPESWDPAPLTIHLASLRPAVWWGVAGGVGVSIIFGIIFIAVYYTAQSNLFKGTNRDWFKGIISWIAAALITYLGFAMLRFVGWEEKWKRRLEAAVQQKVSAHARARWAWDKMIANAGVGRQGPHSVCWEQ